ncbi:Selenoprotein S [Plecturocebus cupreus]
MEESTMGSLLATYGWYIVFSCILLYVVFQKLSARLRALRQRQLDRAAAAVEPDIVVKRQEALAAARLKMQEELNAQVEKHKEKLKQLEEEKRRQKIEMWDSMQEGKSYKGNAKKPQVITLCLVKEVEPVLGDLDAEARHLADEAKNLVVRLPCPAEAAAGLAVCPGSMWEFGTDVADTGSCRVFNDV